MQPIGVAFTCFKEKFGIPRQPGLVPASYGTIELNSPYNREEALRGLETFSHIIITFVPHHNPASDSLTVRPPRLGGNKKMGVFATRSPFRPNPICTSIVQLDSIDFKKGTINFSNHDLLNETPILDIKPYIPKWDSFPNASQGWLVDYPDDNKINVLFSQQLKLPPESENLIRQILSLNPVPRYESEKKEYAFKIEQYDVHFKIQKDGEIIVFGIDLVD